MYKTKPRIREYGICVCKQILSLTLGAILFVLPAVATLAAESADTVWSEGNESGAVAGEEQGALSLPPVAQVGDAKYLTIDEAIESWTNGTTLTLLSDVVLSDVIKLSSTEYHVLDLGTYTMTAASKKDAIQIVNSGRSSAGYTLDIKADATDPGGITATGKAIVRTTGKSGVKDRPIISFYNGIFTGSYVVYHSGSNNTNCPQFRFYGGIFHGTIYTNRTLNQFYGGTFNGGLQMSVDSSAYTLIAGGTFKNLSNSFGSALNSGKFTIGSAKGVYDREVYIDDNGNYVIVNAEPEGIEAAVAKTPGANDYLKYSKVATAGILNYTDVTLAFKNNKTATITVYVDVIDLADANDFTGTVVVPEGNELTILNAPDGLDVQGNAKIVRYVAQVGNEKYETLAEAIAAANTIDGDVTVTLLNNITLDAMIVNTKKVTLDLCGKTITGIDNTEKNFSLIDNRGELTITGNGTITLTATVNSGWNRYSAVIANNPGGKLVIENGTVAHLGGTDMAYGIDNLTNGKGTYAETVIRGGTVKSTYRGIRQFLNGVEAQNILTVNGGAVEGSNKAIFFHDPSTKANTGTLTIGESATINGDVYLFVTAGSAEWPVEISIAASALNGEIVTGNVPDGYALQEFDGVYVVANVCADENKDHACDYGCDVAIGTHADADKDHACDWCKARLSECSYTRGVCTHCSAKDPDYVDLTAIFVLLGLGGTGAGGYAVAQWLLRRRVYSLIYRNWILKF